MAEDPLAGSSIDTEDPRSTVVVVTWRGARHIGDCLDALAAQDRPHRTLVIDNASDDGTAAVLAAHPSAPDVLRLPRNVGYAGGLAAALPLVRTEYLAWLNDDTVPSPGWLAALESTLDTCDDVAAVGSILLRDNVSTQSAGVWLTGDGHGADINGGGFANNRQVDTRQPVEVFGFCGGAALLRTKTLRDVGGVPAEFFCYYEDTDTAWRLRLAGHRVVTAPAAEVRHAHGASTQLGSRSFHRWNERNRLLTLIRCAPTRIAATELARFAAITAALPIRRLTRKSVPDAPNFLLSLRFRVLAEVIAALPRQLRARHRFADRRGREAVWRRWRGVECGPP